MIRFQKDGKRAYMETNKGADMDLTALAPVSYTHLDVYKRQPLCTSMPPNRWVLHPCAHKRMCWTKIN